MLPRKDNSVNRLPVLPQGDPNITRAKPKSSAMDLAATKSVKKHALVEPGPEKTADILADWIAISPSHKMDATNLSSSRKPDSTSPGGLVPDKLRSKKEVIDAAVMPLPTPIRTGAHIVGSRQVRKPVTLSGFIAYSSID